MNLPIYQVDAFASALFKGNPAAVIPLTAWIDDELMQQIAAENNLAETVFFVPQENSEADFHIRWFTPEFEINLCSGIWLADGVYFMLSSLYRNLYGMLFIISSHKTGTVGSAKKKNVGCPNRSGRKNFWTKR